MRISDCSSDVCSSDLLVLLLPLRRQGEVGRGCLRFALIRKTPLPNPSGPPAQLACVRRRASQWLANESPDPLLSHGRGPGVRKSVVEGKSVVARGARGGRRFIQIDYKKDIINL